jgi:hypothetical protein
MEGSMNETEENGDTEQQPPFRTDHELRMLEFVSGIGGMRIAVERGMNRLWNSISSMDATTAPNVFLRFYLGVKPTIFRCIRIVATKTISTLGKMKTATRRPFPPSWWNT